MFKSVIKPAVTTAVHRRANLLRTSSFSYRTRSPLKIKRKKSRKRTKDVEKTRSATTDLNPWAHDLRIHNQCQTERARPCSTAGSPAKDVLWTVRSAHASMNVGRRRMSTTSDQLVINQFFVEHGLIQSSPSYLQDKKILDEKSGLRLGFFYLTFYSP